MEIFGDHFYFVRHAESLWNKKQLCQGHLDIELSPEGRLNSIDFAKKIALWPIDCICTSPLKRAYHTAEIIHQHLPDARLEIIDEFKERNWGELEGISSEEMYGIERKEEADPNFIPNFGVEERDEFKKRISIGLNKAFHLHPFPLIVSHGRLFLALCELLELPLSRQIPNLALFELRYDGFKWSINNQ